MFKDIYSALLSWWRTKRSQSSAKGQV